MNFIKMSLMGTALCLAPLAATAESASSSTAVALSASFATPFPYINYEVTEMGGQGALESISLAAAFGQNAAATASSTKGATAASAAATSYDTGIMLDNEFDSMSGAYESDIDITNYHYLPY